MRVRLAVALMTVLLLLYILLAGQRAVVLLGSGQTVGVVMGVALIVLPLLALWAIGRELWFGVRAQRLGERLDAEGGLPDENLPVRPSGRIERADGDALFPQYRADVEQHPGIGGRDTASPWRTTRRATAGEHARRFARPSGSRPGNAASADPLPFRGSPWTGGAAASGQAPGAGTAEATASSTVRCVKV